MLKWIGGCAVLVIVVVAGGIWYGYRKISTIAEGGNAASITINAPATRVFANMVDVDSMTEWRAEGLGIRANRKGPLTVGDTLQVQTKSTTDNRQMRSTWIVSAMIPDRLLVTEMRNDSTGQVALTRRDSLAALGDSTIVVTTLVQVLLDSMRAARADSEGGTMLNMASKFMVAAMRVQSELELKRLKARLEGDSVPPLPGAPPTPRSIP
jgi:uncharacterized protein YndB with AHSA1/START domain